MELFLAITDLEFHYPAFRNHRRCRRKVMHHHRGIRRNKDSTCRLRVRLNSRIGMLLRLTCPFPRSMCSLSPQACMPNCNSNNSNIFRKISINSRVASLHQLNRQPNTQLHLHRLHHRNQKLANNNCRILDNIQHQ
jgi:hypothetical protein